jgi:DNA primase
VAGRIRDEDVKRVRDAADIVDVVGSVVQLRGAGGGNLKGLCPFHDEKSPSFQVSPAKGFYHCFGCQEGGDVIDFVQKIDHRTFAEAVEQLAGQYNIELRYTEGGYTKTGERGERTRLLEAHKVAAAYFVEQLGTPGAAKGREFLDSRGFDGAAVEKFGVGYAPESWEGMVRHLRGRGFTDKEILTGGLASEGRRGAMDRFRHRLMWPIADLSGDVIGFGGRRLTDDPDTPKYLNTPETPIYKKSSVLYGLDIARREIVKQERAVVVEGYTDVMACHVAGVPTAVATCGTAFGEEHIKILRRLLSDRNQFLGCEVVFTFDGDSAGQKAALRTFLDEQKFVTQTFVSVEPNGLDPCDLRLRKGDAAVRELIAMRSPLFSFALDAELARHDLNSSEGKLHALRAAAPIVARIREDSMRDDYVRRLAGKLGIEEHHAKQAVLTVRAALVRQAAGAAAGGSGGPGGRPGAPNGPQGGGRGRQQAPRAPRIVPGQEGLFGTIAALVPPSGDAIAAVEREVLKAALQNPSLAGREFDGLTPDEFTVPAYAAVRTAVLQAGGTASSSVVGPSGEGWVERVRAEAPDDAIRGLVTELTVEAMRSRGPADERYVGEQMKHVRIRTVNRRIAEVRSRLQRLNPVQQTEDYNKLFGELVALEQYRRGLTDVT